MALAGNIKENSKETSQMKLNGVAVVLIVDER